MSNLRGEASPCPALPPLDETLSDPHSSEDYTQCKNIVLWL